MRTKTIKVSGILIVSTKERDEYGNRHFFLQEQNFFRCSQIRTFKNKPKLVLNVEDTKYKIEPTYILKIELKYYQSLEKLNKDLNKNNSNKKLEEIIKLGVSSVTVLEKKEGRSIWKCRILDLLVR